MRRSNAYRSRLLLALFTAAAAVLVFGAGSASALQKDPDSAVDPARLGSVLAQLLAPDATIGDADATPVGVGTDPVGIDSLTATTTSSSSSPNTFFVDNTPANGDCPPASYPTIQAAVNASGPNDTVKVCPGTYPEQIRVVGPSHDGLKLESLKPLQAIIQWPTLEMPPLALVYFNDVEDVTLRGFTVRGPYTFAGCSPERHEGVLVDDAFGIRITHNHITAIQNANPALYGCQEGDAVSIGRRDPVPCAGSAGSARIEHNLIDEYQKNGVQVFNPGSYADVDHNEITGSTNPLVQVIIASNGVVVICGAAAQIDHNEISNNNYTPFPLSSGIIVAEAPSGSSSVDHNVLFDNDYGIAVDTQNQLEVSHNDVFDHRADGIYLCGDPASFCGPATGNVVRSNLVEANDGYGIALYAADANLVKSNHVERNGTPAGDTTDGLFADSGSGGNQIISNHMDDNVAHDCHDGSSGLGTAGTANFWRSNRGETQNRPGLCRS
jgi:parallel beta-helix repeat protein